MAKKWEKTKESPCKHGQAGYCESCSIEVAKIAYWANQFGRAILRSVRWWEQEMAPRYPGARPSINKFEEEAKELIEDPENKEEAADVLIALVIYAYRKGWDLPGLVQVKMAINEAREWGEPDENGTVRHVVHRCTPQCVHPNREPQLRYNIECGCCRYCEARGGCSYDPTKGYHHPQPCPMHEVSRTPVEAAPQSGA